MQREDWLQALGGQANVKRVEAVAGGRLRIEVADSALVDIAALQALGARVSLPSPPACCMCCWRKTLLTFASFLQV
jgi:PTS system N-acetylglucosamine-specific IIC component